jgi:hypothetical protein
MVPKNCSGHFAGYPMVPAAISAYILTHAAGILFREINNTNYYKITNLKLSVLQASFPLKEHFIEVIFNKDKKTYKDVQQDLTELNSDGNRTRGRNGEDNDKSNSSL